MAIRVPNLGLGDGKTGDTELKIRQDYNHNFNDQSNAASRLVGAGADQIPLSSQVPSLLGAAATKNVGTAAGNVMEVGAFGLGAAILTDIGNISKKKTGSNPTLRNGIYNATDLIGGFVSIQSAYGSLLIGGSTYTGLPPQYAYYSTTLGNKDLIPTAVHTFWTTQNATRDSNGFIKSASPVIDMYDNKIDLNPDAEQQGGITFEKLGVGDYLIKGSLGFAQEGWYIETPKDANGNVLVAVVYEQLANNDLSIKTYAKKFDDETGDIVANLLKPRDIPTGRFISLRLHELPKEPPVMPMDEPTTEV